MHGIFFPVLPLGVFPAGGYEELSIRQPENQAGVFPREARGQPVGRALGLGGELCALGAEVAAFAGGADKAAIFRVAQSRPRIIFAFPGRAREPGAARGRPSELFRPPKSAMVRGGAGLGNYFPRLLGGEILGAIVPRGADFRRCGVAG